MGAAVGVGVGICERAGVGGRRAVEQLASVVVNEGVEACTTNLCHVCFNKHLQAKRRRTTNKCEVEAGCGEEGVSVKNVDNDGKRTIRKWNVGRI